MCNLEHDEFNSGFQILRTGPSSTDAHAPRRTRRRRSTKARRSEGSSSIKETTTASLLRGFAAFENSRVLATRLRDGPPPRTTKNTKTTIHEGPKIRRVFFNQRNHNSFVTSWLRGSEKHSRLGYPAPRRPPAAHHEEHEDDATRRREETKLFLISANLLSR